ncbi:hypothetical protein BRD00_03425 [Halobacteriales archaeon QS_8_69_26]|nr:MAG: hypothetical protein BRD00_03425 [Halobacteriales archaeon QS_8_69_26]
MDDPDAIVHAWFEDLFGRGDLSVAHEVLAADVDYHGPGSLSPGSDGKITEVWSAWDTLAMARALDVVPSLDLFDDR